MAPDRTILYELVIISAMNICLVSPDYPQPNQPIVSGLARVNQTLALGLVEQGHQVTVIALSRQETPVEQDRGVRVYRKRSGNVHWYMSKLPWIGKHLILALREIENSRILAQQVALLHHQVHFDIVEGAETGSLFLALRRDLPPLVIRLHGEEHTFLSHTIGAKVPLAHILCRRIQRIALRRAPKLISPSKAHAEYIAHEIKRSPEKIAIVPHSLPRVWSVPNRVTREPIVLFVGRLELVKGIFDALACFAVVLKVVPEARLVVIGPNHPNIAPVQIQARISELGLTQQVELLGKRLPQEVIAMYNCAAVLLMPSFYETFGMVALEAMTMGLPVVAYASGGLTALIPHEQAGYVVRRGDIDQLARGVIKLLSEPTTWETMSATAQQVAEGFSIANYVHGSLTVYGQV